VAQTLHVDKPAHGGSCVGRLDGQVVFCRHSLPGETVAAEITEDSGRFLRADAVAVLEANPHRQTSPCAWFGPGMCGGCSWLHATPAEQVRLKSQVLSETLERLGGVAGEVPVVSLGLESGWRTRMTLHADAAGRLGFHAARSDHIVPVGDCLQAADDLDLAELLARQWPAGADVHVSASTAGRAVITRRPDGSRDLDGPDEHLFDVHGRLFACAVDGFWQSHRLAPEVLVDEVRGLVDGAGSIVDLYAGVGLFGLSLLTADVARLVLVEGDRRAAAYARQNAAGDDRVRVIARDVRQWRSTPADLVVLDPPRAGAGKGVVSAVAGSGAGTIVYVSCEPSTLARDLALFAAHGYRPDHLRGFDLFPGTAHVETVVRLRRQAG
jgi:tRNA/tmRNA/rRNA uracil-C5-methylase (TrmA/RlmC/RlmD family)